MPLCVPTSCRDAHLVRSHLMSRSRRSHREHDYRYGWIGDGVEDDAYPLGLRWVALCGRCGLGRAQRRSDEDENTPVDRNSGQDFVQNWRGPSVGTWFHLLMICPTGDDLLSRACVSRPIDISLPAIAKNSSNRQFYYREGNSRDFTYVVAPPRQ